MELLYILKLEGEKYYVGTTDNLNRDYHLHMTGKGGAWTARYRPIAIREVRAVNDPYDETRTVKKLMLGHGIDGVRGGPYTQMVFSDDLKMVLLHELNGGSLAQQMVIICYRCGRVGHKSPDCYAEYHAEGYRLGE